MFQVITLQLIILKITCEMWMEKLQKNVCTDLKKKVEKTTSGKVGDVSMAW